jgi:ribonuclease HI
MLSGPLLWVTNNEAEAFAILQAAMALPYGTEAVLFTDSSTCMKWFGGSQCNNPRAARVVEAYRVVREALCLHIKLVKVRGHSTCPGNNRCDHEAVRQRNIAIRLSR